MAAITYWNRIEPRPESYSIEEGLSAKIRDPLWMLARQFQMGEFRGEDAGSPAYVEIMATESRMTGPVRDGIPAERVDVDKKPIEVLVEDEAFTPDLSVSVELGGSFEALLARRLGAIGFFDREILDIRDGYRLKYSIQLPSEKDLDEMKDQQTARFLRVCAGRSLDGYELYLAALKSLPDLPPGPEIDSRNQDAAKKALEAAKKAFDDFVQGAKDVFIFREPEKADPMDWRPERLEYSSDIAAASPSAVEGNGGAVSAAGTMILTAEPDSFGDLDWYSFDLKCVRDDWTPPDPDRSIRTINEIVIPTNVKFRGMANPRWWDFEKWTTDFGDIRPDKQDIARLVFMEFMLIQVIDWFSLPLYQMVGSMCRVDSMVVTDVFGDMTMIERAERVDDKEAVDGGRWTIFSTAQAIQPYLADFFLVSPSASMAKQSGPIIEDVRFLRDQAANMAWGIENTTENGIGQPWLGHERAIVFQAKPEPQESGTPIQYLIQTVVPENWIPFIPVLVDRGTGRFMLQMSSMLDSSGKKGNITPLGRILNPVSVASKDLYRIFEEEVPRAGARVCRELCRSRWTDGSTHIWINRRKAAGTGEGSSGLKFDLAMRKAP